jgi:hypothetical protein
MALDATRGRTAASRAVNIETVLATRPVQLGCYLMMNFLICSFFLAAAQVNLQALRSIAVGGLVNNDFRRRVWPLLLGLSPSADDAIDFASLLRPHRYVEQIEKDVERSMGHWLIGRESERFVCGF